jgi:polyhydroxyalkanoate synthase subunit PhaC
MPTRTATRVQKQFDNGLKLLTKIHVDEVQVGTTPKDLVFEIDKVRLFRYRLLADKASSAAPVLVVYGVVGRYTMADLQPDRSLIRNLLAQGLTVYVVDWGNPNRADTAGCRSRTTWRTTWAAACSTSCANTASTA